MMGEVIRVSGRAPDVGDFLREAMLSQRFADVALCCPGGQRFLAHRLVLSAASPYLQDVLLAHSKGVEYCEPITVILAEVEGPELAAILGFVYTGSATVPRLRLNAFLRAAEALHIQLPPLPVFMKNCVADYKPEDLKDVKISTNYLECEQYPSNERWFRPRQIIPHYEEGLNKKETPSPGFDDFSRTVSHTAPKMFRGSESPIKYRNNLVFERQLPVEANYWQTNHESVLDLERDQRSVECSEVLDVTDVSYSSKRPCELGPDNLDVLEMRISHDPCGFESANNRKSDDTTRRANFGVSGGSYQIRDRFFEDRIPPLYCATIGTSNNIDYSQAGEDLTCGESCCRWRPPRRHVANQVTASPWRQLARPHHSPKIQPIVLQSHLDTPMSMEPQQRISPSCSPSDSPKPFAAINNHHTQQIPPSPEKRSPNEEESLIQVNQERRQDFYLAPIPGPIAQPVILPAVMPRPVQPFYPNSTQPIQQIQPTTRPFYENETTQSAISHLTPIRPSPKKVYFGHQNCQKPEISHPISRLCDSIPPKEAVELIPLEKSLETKIEVESHCNDKIALNVSVLSDSNNNDASGDQFHRVRNNSNSEDHRCDQCGKTFVTRASLKVHSRTHSGEKPFRCADCGKQFSQLRNYKYHRSVHEGTREFAATCPECGKYFNDRGYLSSHMKIHRNRKEYACGECGKSFNQRVAYNMHVRIHTGVKPHQCDQCGKAFSRKMLLKQHLRTHSGERPYECQVCHKAFADRSNMTLHTRLHSGLKPYECTLCTKAFTKKHHLKTHLNYHTGTKPYSCPNCGLRFSQSSNMRTHYKKCAINNPNGIRNSQNELVSSGNVDSENHKMVQKSPGALTPPNSDQESSVLTPLSRSVCETRKT
ncbi:uncharacterized protein LOC117179966 [Belonocnema kinseyi]|uniref:uncharacterized protein LOC117179966 n=1 Tax=Belonocnema kinseyi TaxID=2817044 RepID=UPI00143DAEA4|nr:uncharacterized protein LOC117179966 [Belonocnema kinseyi]